ncbi:MAG: oligopeptide transport system ATP-binding protein [Pseudomonadota bacterium]|nr:oligopeptide transport system ATP-binding protein [Pseudomonadota bacterium]
MLPILKVKDLSIQFKKRNICINAVNKVSFALDEGEVLGIVGESGSGKSQTVLAIMGLLAKNALTSGSVKLLDQELLGLNNIKLNKIRGNRVSMIFQDPMTSLNPYLTIQSQMTEVLMLHKGISHKNALNESLKMLDLVKISDAKRRIKLYPHEFSGGMRQRVMIAMALLCKPELLIADEPTTALDVTVQAQILELLRELKNELNMAVILITHDMGVIANVCDRVCVMYAGNIMEGGTIEDIFYAPKHPYTVALLESIPKLEQDGNDIDAKLKTIPGEPPNLIHLPAGCAFQDRCSCVHEACRHGEIEPQFLGESHIVKCNLQFITSGAVMQNSNCHLASKTNI